MPLNFSISLLIPSQDVAFPPVVSKFTGDSLGVILPALIASMTYRIWDDAVSDMNVRSLSGCVNWQSIIFRNLPKDVLCFYQSLRLQKNAILISLLRYC